MQVKHLALSAAIALSVCAPAQAQEQVEIQW